MTRKLSRREKSRQSGAMKNQKKTSGVLLAAVSVLSASLGVTAAQAAGEIKTDGGSAPEFNTKVAQTSGSPSLQSSQTKHKPKVSNQSKSSQQKKVIPTVSTGGGTTLPK